MAKTESVSAQMKDLLDEVDNNVKELVEKSCEESAKELTERQRPDLLK